jgi:lipopolysaccharide export system protein LptA
LGHNAKLSVQGGFIRSCRIAYLKAEGATTLNQTIHLRVKFSVTAKGKFLQLPRTDTVLA